MRRMADGGALLVKDFWSFGGLLEPFVGTFGAFCSSVSIRVRGCFGGGEAARLCKSHPFGLGNGELTADRAGGEFLDLTVPGDGLDFACRRVAPDGMAAAFAHQHAAICG